jgi:hypothetical protein
MNLQPFEFSRSFSGTVKAPASEKLIPKAMIGVIGYYGFGNLGDNLLLQNLREFLKPHRVVPVPIGLPLASETARRLNIFDFVILGGGELFQGSPPPPFGRFHEWADDLTVPFGALGLGVTSVESDCRQAVGRLIDRSRFFVVRDEESGDLLDHPKVHVAPDLSFFRPLQIHERRSGEGEVVCGVNLRPGRRKTNDWLKAVSGLKVQIRAAPFSMHPELGDQDVLLELDPFCRDLFPIERFGSINFMIATAFHAVVLAIQTATPVIAINYSPKVRRLMEAAGLGSYVLEWEEPHRLQEAFREAQANRKLIRDKMEAFTREAHARLHKALSGVRTVIDESAHSKTQDTGPRTAAACGLSESSGAASIESSAEYPEIPLDSRGAAAPSEPPSSVRMGHRAPKEIAPVVGVIVDGEGYPPSALRRTLDSCRMQTHPNLRVLVSCRKDSDFRQPVAELQSDYGFQQLTASGDWSERLDKALSTLECDYATWTAPGCAFAEEALELLLLDLCESERADGIHACYFLTMEGAIERRVNLHRAQKPGLAEVVGPCFLVRKSAARSFLRRTRKRGAASKAAGLRFLYNQNSLMFRPSTESESLISRGMLAFARDDSSAGKRLILLALQNEAENLDDVLTDDFAAWVARLAISSSNGADPIRSARRVVESMDPPKRKELRRFFRRVNAHIWMARLLRLNATRDYKQIVHAAMTVAVHDFRWLSNPGWWSVLSRAFFSRPRLGSPRPSG